MTSLEYAFGATDSEDQPVVNGTIELGVIYQLPDPDDLTDDELTAFGGISVVFTAHPYIRETLHSLTGRMGLPPLILDVMRAPLDGEPAGASKGPET